MSDQPNGIEESSSRGTNDDSSHDLENASPQWRAGSKDVDPGQDVHGAEKVDGIGGEDDGSTEREGDDSHLHEDQKSPSFPQAAPEDEAEPADRVPADSPTKTQDLAEAGRSYFDPKVSQE